VRKTFAIAILICFCFLASSAYACISMPELTLLNDTSCHQSIYYGIQGDGLIQYSPYSYAFRNRTGILEDLQRYKNYTYICDTPDNQTGDELRCVASRCNETDTMASCTICRWMSTKYIRLTDNDISVIADYLSNGYSVLKQTPEEYQAFLENANRVNNDLSTCEYYGAAAYRDGWTGYVLNDDSTKTESCANAPRAACAGGLATVLWNELSGQQITTKIVATLLNYWWIFLIVVVGLMMFLLYRMSMPGDGVAEKPFRHALVRHYIPGLRYAILGIILAALVLAAAVGCPARGECSAGILLVFLLLLLFLPRSLKHTWHTIGHSDIFYFIISAAVAVAVLLYLPADGLARVAAAILVFIGLTAAKRVINIRFK
jgi:hypothetical protein